MTTTPVLPAAINLLTIFNNTPHHSTQQQHKQKPIRHPNKKSPSPHIFHIPSWPHSYKRPPRRFTFATKHVVTGGEIMEPNVDTFHGHWGRQPSVELHLPRLITSPVAATSSPLLSFAESPNMTSLLAKSDFIEQLILPAPLTETIIKSPIYKTETIIESPTTQTVVPPPTTIHTVMSSPTTQGSYLISCTSPSMSSKNDIPPTNTVSTPKTHAPPSTPVMTAQQPYQQPTPHQLPPQKPQPQKHTRTRTVATIPPSWVTISMTPTQEESTPQPIHCLCTTSPCHHVIDIPSTYMYPSPSYSELSSYRSTCSNSPLIPHETTRPSTHTRYPSQWHHWRVPSYLHFDSPNQKVSSF